jgi:hypothetical protein
MEEQQALLNAQTAAALSGLQKSIELSNLAFRDLVVEMRQGFIDVRAEHAEDHKDHETRIRIIERKVYQAIGGIGVVSLLVSLALHFWK